MAALPRVWVPLLLLLCLPEARAQTERGLEDTPTRGVFHPGAGIADGAEPASVTLNPAAMGEVGGLLLGLRHTETAGESLWGGRGTGLYAATPLPLLRGLKFGAALEVLRPPQPADLPTNAKLTLSAAYRVLPALSLGLSYAHLFLPENPRYGDLDTVSLGARLRLGRVLGLGVVLRDVNGPASLARPGSPVPRTYEAELLFRPLSDERLEVATGAALGQSRLDVEARLRLFVRPLRGLGVGAEAAMLTGVPGRGYAYRAGVGLEVNLAHVGGSLFGLFGEDPGGAGVAGHGVSVGLRVSAERYPALWEGGAGTILYRVEPAGLEGAAYLQLLDFLRRLEEDRRAAGVVLLLADLPGGWGRADELRAQLLRLRQARKHVYVYASDLSTRGLYVASAAQRIFLDPTGSVRLLGVSLSGWYVKEALDLFGIRADLLRIGDFKATPESFTRAEASRKVQEEREAVVESLFAHLGTRIAAGRGLRPGDLPGLFARGLFTPEGARAAGLVDAVATAAEVEREIRREAGADLRVVPFAPGAEGRGRRARTWVRPAIAVVNVEGDLLGGESRTVPLVGLKLAGGVTLSRALDEAQRDERVQAIVLRIESPGGSVQVADLLARQVEDIRRRKPVVCSFGDVAASGGYYVAAPCSLIFASPMTLTGSIGIFGGKVDASGLLDRLGVRARPVTRGPHADMDEMYRPYSEAERERVREQLLYGYERFLQVVAQGRHMSRDEADAVAQGRIWSGAQAHALRHRLCDRLGGLMDAVAEARSQAALPAREDVELVYYPRERPGLLSQLLHTAFDLPLPEAQGTLGFLGLRRLGAALFGLHAALLLLENPVLARLESDVPR